MPGKETRSAKYSRWDSYLGYAIYGAEVRYRDGTTGLEFAVGVPSSDDPPPHFLTLQAAKEHCEKLGPTTTHTFMQWLIKLWRR